MITNPAITFNVSTSPYNRTENITPNTDSRLNKIAALHSLTRF